MRRIKLVYLHILLNSFMSNLGGHDCSFSIGGGGGGGGHDCSFSILGGHVPPVPPRSAAYANVKTWQLPYSSSNHETA